MLAGVAAKRAGTALQRYPYLSTFHTRTVRSCEAEKSLSPTHARAETGPLWPCSTARHWRSLSHTLTVESREPEKRASLLDEAHKACTQSPCAWGVCIVFSSEEASHSLIDLSLEQE